MLSAIAQWLGVKWRLTHIDSTLQAYSATFNTPYGQLVLQHLIDNVYCQVYEGNDPIELAHHNGQRLVVHRILQNIDRASQPAKYAVMESFENGSAS